MGILFLLLFKSGSDFLCPFSILSEIRIPDPGCRPDMDATSLSLHAQFHIVPKAKDLCGKNSPEVSLLLNLDTAPQGLHKAFCTSPCLPGWLRKFERLNKKRAFRRFATYAIGRTGTGSQAPLDQSRFGRFPGNTGQDGKNDQEKKKNSWNQVNHFFHRTSNLVCVWNITDLLFSKKDGAYRPSSEAKDPHKQTMDEGKQGLSQGPQGQSIKNLVRNPGRLVQVKKTMGVNPEAVGPPDLFVNKLKGRVPPTYSGLPREGNAK